MRLTMSDEKLNQVVSLTQEHVNASEEQIADFIDGGEEGWECGDDEQQEWLDSTDADEIASWAIAGLR